jgi:hypothetical protein
MAINQEEFAADVLALRAVVHALIKTHPYPALLLEAFQKERETFELMALEISEQHSALIHRKLTAFDLTLQEIELRSRTT